MCFLRRRGGVGVLACKIGVSRVLDRVGCCYLFSRVMGGLGFRVAAFGRSSALCSIRSWCVSVGLLWGLGCVELARDCLALGKWCCGVGCCWICNVFFCCRVGVLVGLLVLRG